MRGEHRVLRGEVETPAGGSKNREVSAEGGRKMLRARTAFVGDDRVGHVACPCTKGECLELRISGPGQLRFEYVDPRAKERTVSW